MWLLGGIAVLLGGVAFFVLRKRNDVISATPHGAGGRPVATLVDLPDIPVQLARASAATPAVAGQGVLIESLKEELFALEQDKVSGKISDTKYADAKAGLEAMLRRILKTR